MQDIEQIQIRAALKEDVPSILALVKELAAYERASHEVSNTVFMMEADGFGENPIFWAIVAEHQQQIIGLSLYYIRYSTWKGKSLYLEDIIVHASYRRKGIGKRLFEETIKAAQRMQVKGMTWQVLDWNQPAIDFYRKYPCSIDDEWLNCKLSEEFIQSFVHSIRNHT